MWGSSIGELNVYVKTTSGLSKLWTKSGDQGNEWKQGHASLFMSRHYGVRMRTIGSVFIAYSCPAITC